MSDELIHLGMDPDAEPTSFVGEGFISVPMVLSFENIDYQETPEQLQNLINVVGEVATEVLHELVKEYKEAKLNQNRVEGSV